MSDTPSAVEDHLDEAVRQMAAQASRLHEASEKYASDPAGAGRALVDAAIAATASAVALMGAAQALGGAQ